MFDWRLFFARHGIPYAEKGPNVSRGNIAIRCPICGPADPSEHMNVSLKGRGWACWRNADHKGKSPVRLVQLLLQCSTEEANEIVHGTAVPVPTDEDFLTRAKKALTPSVTEQVTSLTLPSKFKPLWKKSVLSGPHRSYLVERGYAPAEIDRLAERFKMHWAAQGPWSGRVLFPIYDLDGKLLTWTGRAISKRMELRYKTLDREASVTPVAETLFDLPYVIKQSGTLVVCEGVFDALRITWFGQTMDVVATCLFGLRSTAPQLDLLRRLQPQFKRMVLLLDRGASTQAMRLLLNLDRSNTKLIYLPDHIKDPGATTGAQALTLCRQLACQ